MAPEGIEEAAGVVDELGTGRAEVTALATSPTYEDAADRLDADLDAAGLDDAIDEGLRTGQADLPRVVEAVMAATDAWRQFHETVRATAEDLVGNR